MIRAYEWLLLAAIWLLYICSEWIADFLTGIL